jgi:isochorismate hydrolase
MMEWALGLLVGTAALLLIFSFMQNRHVAKSEQRKLDTMYLGMMEEINKLQTQVKSIEIDGEITAQEVGITPQERQLLRELLDLYKRGYSMESIASKIQVNEDELQELLAPYITAGNERSKVANEH